MATILIGAAVLAVLIAVFSLDVVMLAIGCLVVAAALTTAIGCICYAIGLPIRLLFEVVRDWTGW